MCKLPNKVQQATKKVRPHQADYFQKKISSQTVNQSVSHSALGPLWCFPATAPFQNLLLALADAASLHALFSRSDRNLFTFSIPLCKCHTPKLHSWFRQQKKRARKIYFERQKSERKRKALGGRRRVFAATPLGSGCTVFFLKDEVVARLSSPFLSILWPSGILLTGEKMY